MHRVMAHPATYENCRDAVERVFDLFPQDVTGKKVLVKPNALRASDAEQAIVTHPAVVGAVVEKLEAMDPAEIVVGDNPGMMSYGANEETFKQSGLLDAAKGHYRNIGTDVVDMDFPKEFMDRVGVSRAVAEADILISVPKLKTHGLTIITGVLKNSYGFLPGAIKAKLHRISGNALRFGQMMVEVYRLRPPDLSILDAVVGMEGNGPACEDLREIGCILASDNGVALDATMSRMMGVDPRILPYFEMAKQRGLGDYLESAIEVLGDIPHIPDFKLPPISEKYAEVSTGDGEFFSSRILLRPKTDPGLCTACETCIDQCPVSALSMVDGLPVVDSELCITCFCCQEICPDMAIKLT